MSLKPRFWKPGEQGPNAIEERTSAENESNHCSFIYNPNHSLSIEQQRQRLPIFHCRNHILYLLEKIQTLVVVGETGCGKSTQLPQYLIEAGWARDGKMVGVTQPRRIATITLANRVAEEKYAILGDEVGYSIRFDNCWNPQTTKIKYLTEGVLIREMMGDPLLKHYSIIMLDEVHERSIYSDILLGLLKKILKKRPDLHLIVASATLDAESIRDFLNLNETDDTSKNTATILSIEGRAFPVDIYYLAEPTPDYVKESVTTVIKIHEHKGEGDVLVFLTGQEEVDLAVSMLKEYSRGLKDEKESLLKLMIVPMYSSLPSSEQMKAFCYTPRTTRKVVVATNIAEASITIRNIIYVVDCGFVKQRYFNSKTGTDSLVVVPISQASAEQRAGRAGRVRSGEVYRLYTEESYQKLSVNSVPEIQRTNLAGVILQLKTLGIDNILRFSFPAAPPARNMISGLDLLFALEALDEDGKLTQPMGERMAEFALSPMFSKMLLKSNEFGCLEEVLTITAMMQIQCIFLNPTNQTHNARRAHRKFAVKEGDMITLLNVYNAFLQNQKNKRWCDQNFLHYKGLLRAVEIRQQLQKLLKQFGYPMVSADGDVDAVCRCITVGFFANAAYLHHSGVYKTIRGDHPLHIHPTSVLYTEEQPQWVIFGEVLHTSLEYMRDITVVQPEWLYELAPHYYQYGTDREIRMDL